MMIFVTQFIHGQTHFLPSFLLPRRRFTMRLMTQAEPSSKTSARHMKPTPPRTPVSNGTGTDSSRCRDVAGTIPMPVR